MDETDNCHRPQASSRWSSPGRDIWLDPSRPKPYLKTLYIGRYTSVWAQYVEVEGSRYVKSLSTRRLTQEDTLVFKARFKKSSAINRPEACVNMYYSEDHLGIRDIIITEDEELPPLKMEVGLSWAIYHRQKTPFRFTLRHDNGTLPEHAGTPSTWKKNLIRGIVSHKLGEPEPQTRDEYGSTDKSWFHMPIDSDERVSELWLRRGQHESVGSEEFETLIVRTTKGRSFIPGLDSVCSFPIGETCKFRYKAIAIFPPEVPSRMFYCRAKHLWTYFAFEQTSQLDDDDDGSDEWLPWHMNVTSFCLSEPVPNEETKYIKIPFGGRLEWAVFGFTIAARHVEEGEPFAHNLFEILCGRLPQEVCRNIATHCTRERAIQAIQEQWLAMGPSQKRLISVPIRHGVTLWAQYIYFEGERCLQSFSYESRGGDEEMLLGGNSQGPLNVFIRHHSLEVDKVVVTEGKQSPRTEQVGEHWWTVYVQQHQPSFLKARFDGIKIRDLVLVKSSYDFLEYDFCRGPCEILWAIPSKPVKYTLKIPLPMGLNETLTPTDDFEDFDPNLRTWLYFALSPDEKVSELWIRQYPQRIAPLLLVTDQGRSFVLGTQQDGPGATYHPIAKLSRDKPCAMFYSHPYALTWIQPGWKSDPYEHYKSAQLDGLRGVTPCINKGPFKWGEDEIITGLLLTYHDGSRSCIGEVRYHRFGTTKKATSETMWIRYVEQEDVILPDGDYYGVDVGIEWFGFSQPPASPYLHEEDNTTGEPGPFTDGTPHEGDDASDGEILGEETSDDEGSLAEPARVPQYFTVPLRGRLDWVMSSDSSICVLSHHEGSEPNDEKLQVLAEDVKFGRAGPVVGSISSQVGDISPGTLSRYAGEAAKKQQRHIRVL
ncbi:hypothetical protein DER46DRAFT_652651 [Fusarium sp. MPI-SDFR-AT-0072]|nr:hypothetical protein DER46DRAFT_652651 [Fusarium sp. MPI-SDFR-AT-0072]